MTVQTSIHPLSLDLRDRVWTVPQAQSIRYGGYDYKSKTTKSKEDVRSLIHRHITYYVSKKQTNIFQNIHNEYDMVELLHPHPELRLELARDAHLARRIGWRGAEIAASVNALDLNNTQHWLWAFGLERINLGDFRFRQRTNEERYWNLSQPWRVPTGIPKGTPTDEDRQRWQPGTTAWEVEEAALHELEEHMGGIATMYLHDYLPNKDERIKARSTVETYLMINKQTLPEDPWDPNNWGHDARLSSLTIRDLQTLEAIELTPDFDPEVLEYTTNHPITGISLAHTPKDSLANSDFETSPDRTSISITVTAKDGKTTRIYKVSVV